MKFLVFIEQRNGEVRKASLEVLRLASRMSGGPVAAVLAGRGIGGLALGLSSYGAGTVYLAERDELALYSSQGYVAALEAARVAAGADVVLMGATAMGKDLAPRFAAHNNIGVLADAVGLWIEGEHLVARRPVYSGKALAVVDCATTALQVATVRPNVFPADREKDAADPKVQVLELGEVEIGACVTNVESVNSNELDIGEANIVVSGGRGLNDPHNWTIIEDLVEALGRGAAAGASRALVDAGWVDHQRQVGQTGRVVTPALYVAVGISGAIQHLVGMRTSKVIVAINKDPNAPIFNFATYGVIADVCSFVPELTRALSKLRRE